MMRRMPQYGYWTNASLPPDPEARLNGAWFDQGSWYPIGYIGVYTYGVCPIVRQRNPDRLRPAKVKKGFPLRLEL
jgi:hypothetical protein